MKQGQIVELKTEKISSDGSCIARAPDGLVVFIPGALPGEVVRGRISVRKKEYAVASLEEIVEKAPGRCTPACPLFGHCGGCQLQHADYETQLNLKRSIVQDAFERIYRNPFPIIEPCIPSPSEWNYRNKTSLPVRKKEGSLSMGYYARRSHEVVPVHSCPVLLREMEPLPGVLHRELSHTGMPPYDERTGRGLLRHVIMRCSAGSGEILVSLVAARKLTGDERKQLETNLLPRLIHVLPGLKTVTVNYNLSKGNVILGGNTEVLLGDGLISEPIPPLRFLYDTTAFFQINTDVAGILYKEAARMALSEGAERVLELYSGVGTLSCFLAKDGASVTAVEEWAAAAALMKENARLNGLSCRLEIFAGPAEDGTPWENRRYDCIVVDPPRSGCSREVLNRLGALSAPRIVYVSCNPATLARDSGILLERGYSPVEIKCFDMFPQTVHVETAVLFERQRR